MPFPFSLPTTAFLSFPQHFQCLSHPSLPYQATNTRGVLRGALKAYKRLPAAQKPAHLPTVQQALQGYIPYLLALHAGLTGDVVAGESIQVDLTKEVEAEWRSTLSSGFIPGRDTGRLKVRSLDAELAFTLLTLAITHYLMARSSLRDLYDRQTAGGALPAEMRTAAIATAMKHYMDAHAVFSCIISKPLSIPAPSPADIATSTVTALAALSIAEATILAVLKDDPFPAAIAADRNANDKSWLVGDIKIPKVRAHLFARLCLAASDHASRGSGLLAVGAAGSKDATKVSTDLAQYASDLRRCARGKACRFLGIDAEAEGQTGTAIAWLRAASQELGSVLTTEAEGSKRGFASRLKAGWDERREDKRVEKLGEWGADAGKLEEGRVVDMLNSKWEKMNSVLNVQAVPPAGPLLASLPSGREYHTPKPWAALMLDNATLAGMRGPVDDGTRRAAGGDGVDDSGDEAVGSAPGAYPQDRQYY